VSRSQRLTFLGIAVLIAVVAVIVLVASSGGGDDSQNASSSATPTATAAPSETPTPTATSTATTTPTPTPTPEIPLVTSDGITKLRFEQGDQIRFRVRSDVADEVHVHGYDLMKDVEPGQTVTFSFPATITGIFEVELESRAQQIAQLRVDP
jgi:New glue protein family